MKLLAAFVGVALSGYGKSKDRFGNGRTDRFGGKSPSTDIQDCVTSDELDPVMTNFARLTNQLGPKVITNIFLETGAINGDNVIVSPVAMTSQLTILHEGAGGQTREELQSLTLMPEMGALEAMSELKHRYECITKGTIATKNAMFLDNSFQPKPEFVNRIQSTQARIFKLNFAEKPDLSRSIIDTWSSSQSGIENTELPEDSITKQTSMLLLSSVQFSAKWAVRFEKSLPGGFLLADGTTKMVDMMELRTTLPFSLSCVDFPDAAACNSDELIPSIINIPLEDPRLQITVLMPNKLLPLGQVLAMSSQWLQYWRYVSESNFQDVVLRVPKLDVLTQLDLSNALFGAGMTNAFDPFIANFTGITDDVGISASNIFQQNYLKWDLDGASAGGDMISSLKLSARNGVTEEQIDTTPQFNVDRPFVLVISDRTTDSNLFMGVINDPRI